MKKRIAEISIVNVVLCLLVVFIHVSSVPVTALDRASWQAAAVFVPWKLASFVVQGFLFLGGMRMYLSGGDRRDYRHYYRSRFQTIYLPYVLWNAVYFLYFVQTDYIEGGALRFLRYLVEGTLVAPFYFVAIILQFYLLAPLWDAMVRRVPPLTAIVAALALNVAFLELAPRAFPPERYPLLGHLFVKFLFYWVCGCYAGRHYERFRTLVVTHRKGCYLAFAVMAAVTIGTGLYGYRTGVGVSFSESLHLVYCVCAIAALFALACAAARIVQSRAFRLLDEASFPIFLFHCLPLHFFNRHVEQWGVTSIGIAYLLRVLFVYIVSIGGCMLFVALHNRKQKTL